MLMWFICFGGFIFFTIDQLRDNHPKFADWTTFFFAFLGIFLALSITGASIYYFSERSFPYSQDDHAVEHFVVDIIQLLLTLLYFSHIAWLNRPHTKRSAELARKANHDSNSPL